MADRINRNPGPGDRLHSLDVADTALGTAFQRAEESARRDALFHDPFAGTLAGQRGAEVARTMSGGWAITVRTRVFDDLLLSTIQEHGVQGVLNLGAGLDTRPYRLDLPARLQWIEVDLPATIEHKERLNRQSLTMRLAWALSPEGKRSEFRRLWTYALLEHRHLPNSD